MPLNWPAVIVLVALINPPVNKLAPVTLPVTTMAFEAWLKVNPVDAAKLPLLL